MSFDPNNFENMIFDYMDQIKVLFSADTWENILLNCTKNEMLVLLLLYRGSDINMSQIAEYLDAPLNTTTGIVSRMEKKDMISRVRSTTDKRVVTIVLTESGRTQISDIMGLIMKYGERVFSSLNQEELNLLSGVIGKLIQIVQNVEIEEQPIKSKVRKIVIE